MKLGLFVCSECGVAKIWDPSLLLSGLRSLYLALAPDPHRESLLPEADHRQTEFGRGPASGHNLPPATTRKAVPTPEEPGTPHPVKRARPSQEGVEADGRHTHTDQVNKLSPNWKARARQISQAPSYEAAQQTQDKVHL
ncbi:hypothetical protein chiPu_0028587 [Chiloscyllium punctatum]|uniref:Uncharacterized protein n=1 Tax=Chiloscyllium punctatum TaxID=137246 RepID=A0A401TNW8_CHIPU|nr:hypothetical protein [Chiloscyllium punctatum]